MFRNHAEQILNTTRQYGKDVWLGETGWPTYDGNAEARNPNSVAGPANAKQYFDKIGCQVLCGSGRGFIMWIEIRTLLTLSSLNLDCFT